ncbi:hypothetical protein PMIN04_010712 [Paraphaeosphaeria minitans]
MLASYETGISFSNASARDAARIVDNLNISSIQGYEDAAPTHDPRLWDELTATKPELANVNIRYEIVIVLRQEHFGDQVLSDWRGKTKGSCHAYQNTVIRRNAQTRMDNIHGGTDIWDE